MSAPPGAGCNLYFNAALSSTAVAVRTTGTLVFYIQVVNLTATDCWLQMFDTAQASVTVGTDTPKQSFLVPGASTAATNAGAITQQFSCPLEFNTALTIAFTTSATGSGTPATAAVVNIGYLAR